ncbi:hypothetical protein Taro_001103 [Colocasia esculenta]|uniref:Uncharacterized protein n=1 Tax=Colocasia esculenta TaxID=4460 RepID=A0A843TJN3_COLES|nr:hypothetical protein [Colocasia esculenta]
MSIDRDTLYTWRTVLTGGHRMSTPQTTEEGKAQLAGNCCNISGHLESLVGLVEVRVWWLTGARGKTLVREAELDQAENSGSGGGFREEASKGSARIEVWQDFLHASEVVRGRLSRFEELCLTVVGLVLLL